MADEHWIDAMLRDDLGYEFAAAKPQRDYTDADFEITDPTRVQESARKAIEKLASAQDVQQEGSRNQHFWPRCSMAFQIAAGSDIPPEYVADRFRKAAQACGMDTDPKGGWNNIEAQIGNAHTRAEKNGALPPAKYAEALATVLPQIDPADVLEGLTAPTMAPQGDTPEHSAAAEPPRPVLEGIEGDFWERRPSLNLVYTASLAQLASPWAVLACCVARILAKVPPEVRLPAIVGGPGNLNWYAAIVAKSGGGKGAAMAVAKRLVSSEGFIERSIGSGEGLIECYNRRGPRKDETLEDAMADWVTSVLFNIEEIDNLGSMGQRTGQTTMGILRQGFSGERLGFSYRGRTNEAVDEGTYRMTLVASVQPERAGTLFEDSGGGTPQRFMWFPAKDRRITFDRPKWPEDPHFGPMKLTMAKPQIGYVEVPDVARSAIVEARVRSQQGDEGVLDGHALYAREKFAYALALMDNRTAISAEDWELASIASAVSDWCRERAQAGYRGGKERLSRERGEMQALADDERALVAATVQERALQRVCGLLMGYLETDGQLSRGDLRKRLSSRDRPRIDKALELLTEGGYVALSDGLFRRCS